MLIQEKKANKVGSQNWGLRCTGRWYTMTYLQIYVVFQDDFPGQAATHIHDAIESSNPGSVEASLISARECYKKGKNDLGKKNNYSPIYAL